MLKTCSDLTFGNIFRYKVRLSGITREQTHLLDIAFAILDMNATVLLVAIFVYLCQLTEGWLSKLLFKINVFNLIRCL